MSVTALWQKGRGHAHEKVSSISRYIPKARVPWQPSRFGRKNLTKDDLVQMWGQGRYRTGFGNYNSGYSTEKTKTLEDHSISIIPKHELEKYMPDISLGPKALVTPVSLMSARGGHRVTHDMLHSYDAHIGAVEKPAVVDHENITPQDTVNFAGLNAAALDCRGRIYRWLRRGPFFQEDQYFRRYIAKDGSNAQAPQEANLFKRIVRLAGKGQLKAACEEYRKCVSVPPVEVFRALTAACIPSGNLGDAVSIFEDGNSRLFYVGRDGEVMFNMMSVAVNAKNRARVVWVYNVMRGRFFENVLVRAEIEPMWQYRIVTKGLEFLLDNACNEEARELYKFLQDKEMLNFDQQRHLGEVMREALATGKPVSLTDTALNSLGVSKASVAMVPAVASVLRQAQESYESALHTRKESSPEGELAWLQEKFQDVDILAVIRLARYRGKKDLMAKYQQQFVDRCCRWLYALSESRELQEGKPLTYLRKSKPSTISEMTRVAWTPEAQKKTRLLPSEQNLTFFFQNGARFVTEVFPSSGESLQSKFLALQPTQTEVSAVLDFSGRSVSRTDLPQLKVVHPSCISGEGSSGLASTKSKADPSAALSSTTSSSSSSSSPSASATATLSLGGVEA